MEYNHLKEKSEEKINFQIKAFDNKASILISAFGIIFAISLAFLQVFSSIKFELVEEYIKNIYIAVFLLFVLNGIFCLFSFVNVIRPRKGKKHNEKVPSYYKDVIKMNAKQLKDSIVKSSENDEIDLDEIIYNADICNKKHVWLNVGIYSLIPFAILMMTLIILLIVMFM